MGSLVALMSSDTKNWKEVADLIKCSKWDNVYLICNKLAFNSINLENVQKFEFDETNPIMSIFGLTDTFKSQIVDFEVCINLSSGTGIEHMALVSSLLKSGLGIRFVHCENNQIKEFEILNEKYIPQDEIDF
ncbi:MAG: hypothetical protein HRU03_07145 [Nanoarchaeales archaeon]|nr:hypothetical protein [Nanoarchaeales archaeon]